MRLGMEKSSDSAAEHIHGPVAAVIVAAGRGEGAGLADGPKQYRNIGGRTVIARTLEAFLAHPDIGPIVVAVHADDEALFRVAAGDAGDRVIVVHGGATRQDSTRLGLLALREKSPGVVLI